MLKKPNSSFKFVSPPKSWVRFGFKLGAIGVACELVCLAATYYGWRKLNSDQEFRHYCNDNYPVILEGFYKVGDLLDPEKTKEFRSLDQQAFAQKSTPKQD